MPTRQTRDAAWVLARDLVRRFGGELGDDERCALFHDLYAFVLPRLDALLVKTIREQRRLGRSVRPLEETDTTEGGEPWTTSD